MTTAALNSRGIEIPSIFFGSPGDWKDWWLAQWADFLEILHAACDPNGMETWVETHIERHKLRRWHD